MRFIYTRTFAIFFVVLLAAAIFVFLQTRGFTDPVKRVLLEAPRPIATGLRAVVSPVVNFFNTVKSLRAVVKENGILTQRVRDLERSQADFDKLRTENTLLLKELGFAKASKFTLVRCTVLSYDPEGITNTFVLNCGKNQGINSGMAIVSEDHIAGRLIFVGNNTSTGQFLTHPQASLDAKISRSGSIGLLKGSYASGLTFESLSQNSDVQKGDLVVSAGVNSLIPPGIVIGEIEQIISKDNDLFKRATVVSPLAFRTLTYVFVVK